MRSLNLTPNLRRLIPYGWLAVATLTAMTSGWLILRMLAGSTTPAGTSTPNRAAPATATRILVNYSPYYSRHVPPAPNPSGKDVLASESSHGAGPVQPSTGPLPPENDLRRLAELLEFHATVRPLASLGGILPRPQVLESSAPPGPAPSPTPMTHPDRAAVVVLEFPPDVPPELALTKSAQAIQRLQQERLSHALLVGQEFISLAQREREVARQWLDKLEQYRLASREIRRDLWQQLCTELKGDGGSTTGSVQMIPADHDVLAELQATYRALLDRRRRLLATRTPEHPEVKQLDATLNEIEVQLRMKMNEARRELGQAETGPSWPPDWIKLPDGQPVASDPLPVAPPIPEDRNILETHHQPSAQSLVDNLFRWGNLQEELDQACLGFAAELTDLRRQMDELTTRWDKAVADCQTAFAWRVAGVLEQPRGATINGKGIPHPLWWHWLVALFVSVLAGEAVYSILEALGRERTIQSPDQLQRITGAPVFTLVIPQLRRSAMRRRASLKYHSAHNTAPKSPHNHTEARSEKTQSSE